MICPCNRLTYVHAKCGDLITITHNNKDYNLNHIQAHAFGVGSGDYLKFTYCMDCGRIQGSFPRPIFTDNGACPDCGCEERLELLNNLTYKSYCKECGVLFP